MKNNKIFLCATIIFVLMFLFLFPYNNYLKNEIYIKCAKDYSPSDYVKGKNVVLGNKVITNEILEKCDINEDNKITNFDLEIIKQMICKVYDYYVIKDGNHIVIKYVK